MGGSSKQTIGYQYFSFFLLFIGNPIEKMLGINFDKRGWQTPLIDDSGNPLSVGVIEKATLYGENEGGVAGQIHARYGTSSQEVVSFYKEYMESKGLQASAYPFQSYLAFPDFYVGNSGYMKEMLLWPKRTRIRNDGRRQWYEVREDGAVVCEIDATLIPIDYLGLVAQVQANPPQNKWYGTWNKDNQYHEFSSKGLISGYDHNFLAQYGGFGKEGRVKTTFPDLNGLVMEIEIWGDDGISFFEWNGGDFKLVREWSEQSYVTCRKYWIIFDPKAPDKSLSFGITDQVPAGSDTRHSCVIWARLVLDPWSLDPNYTVDINPVHKIREVLTDDTAMNKPETSVNDENFIKAADWIWNEGLGVSWSITEKSCMDAINELCYHIEAGIRVNRQTGLYEMVLFRDNWFDENEIHTIAENKIKKGSMQYEITNADEVINQVNVNFYDRANIKNSSFSISESGLIQTLGRVNAETIDFPYFMNMRNAEIVANWKLKILSTGVLKGSFTTGWREARKWNRYDLIKLPWSKRWTGTILVRIMNIKLGGPTSNEVSIEWVEVVPSTGMMNTTIVLDDPIEKPLPPQACQYEPFELPYYLAVMALGQRKVDDELAYESNFGLVGAVAEQPQSNSLYAIMKTHNGVEGEEWLRAASIHYSETADFDQIISKTSTSFTVNNWKKIANVSTGTLIKCGRDWLGTPGEWMVFQGVDVYTGIVSVKRGALDTPPQEWGPGSKLYFCGNDVAFDETEYVAGEEVLVSALTTTPSGVLEQGGSIPIEMKARAIRPYPPANVKINGEYWPAEIEGDLALTWVDRNRLQQTGGEIIGWYEGGVTRETGVKYTVEVYDNQTNTLLTSQSNIDANLVTIGSTNFEYENRIELYSVRDAYESLQRFVHVFNWGTAKWNPLNLSVLPTTFLSTENVVVDALNRISQANNAGSLGGVFTQTNDAKKPVFVDNGMRFTRSAVQQLSGDVTKDPFRNKSIAWGFFVFKVNTKQSTEQIILQTATSADASRTTFTINANSSTFRCLYRTTESGPVYEMTQAITLGQYQIVLAGFNTVTKKHFVCLNGATVVETTTAASGSTTNTQSRGIVLGASYANTNALDGYINTVVCGDYQLSQSDIDKLFGWAAWKYGLQASLPTDHPFKDKAPKVDD